MQLDPARTELIGGFFHSYLKLNKQEQQRLDQEVSNLSKKEVEKIMQFTTPWHEKGWIEGQSKLILRLLRKRFGEVPADLEQTIMTLKSERLEEVGEALFEINNIDELRKILN